MTNDLDQASQDFFRVTAETVRQLLPTVFQRCAYDSIQIEDHTRTATATKSTPSYDFYRTTSRTQVRVRWQPVPSPSPPNAG